MLKQYRLISCTLFKRLLEGPDISTCNIAKFCGVSYLTVYKTNILSNAVKLNEHRNFHNTAVRKFLKRKRDEGDLVDERRSLTYREEFDKIDLKNKKNFIEMVRIYKENVKNRAGHVDFIKAALKCMKDFGLERDIEVYKKILDVLPKGVYIATNRYLVLGMYYPRQQNVALQMISQMEWNGVIPDVEFGLMLKNIFGQQSNPYDRYARYMYWSLKWKNESPFPLPRPLPNDALELAKIAIKRITDVDPQSETTVFQTERVADSIDKTWIVSGQSPKQRKLLENHPKEKPVIVEGGDLVWLREHSIQYFVLRADGEPLPYIDPGDNNDITKIQSKFLNPNYKPSIIKKPSVHEQDDGIIYAVCATGTSSKDSLLSWVRILQEEGNSILADRPVLFRFIDHNRLPVPFSEELVKEQKH